MKQLPLQFSLLDVKAAYATSDKELSNEQLYACLEHSGGLPAGAIDAQPKKLGVNETKRAIRWHQQTLKQAGVIEKTGSLRGHWNLTSYGKTQLREHAGKAAIVGFSTELGVAIWGRCQDVFASIEVPITLCVTSPPYMLNTARAYGNVKGEQAYIDFIVETLEPIVKRLKKSGSIALNVSNDIFESKSPARSLYRERLVLALHDRLGLHKMDELIWFNASKPPGPTYWASITRQQLNVGWEAIYWFSPSPKDCLSDNRRVLQPHSPKHQKYLESGFRDEKVYCDGAYQRRKSSYPLTTGRIPKNVLSFGHACSSQQDYKRKAKAAGLPAHGAPMPLKLAKFLIEFLSREQDLVVDPMGGSMTTGLAAEQTNRRWISSEIMLEYVMGAKHRFESAA